MRNAVLFYFTGVLLAALGLAMSLPLAVSLWHHESASSGLALALGLTLGAGLLLAIVCRPAGAVTLTLRDGLGIVGLCWLGASLAGSLPFVLGIGLSPADGLFESASGFTTTGATVMSGLDATPRGILMWRSLTHWLGGMGIIVLSLAILPLVGSGGMQLYKAEATGPTPDKLTPRIRDTAALLWKVYLLLTAAQTALHFAGGMSLFDSVNHAFATVATGGFSTRDASAGAFSAYHQWVMILFMFLCGVNFTLHYRMLTGRQSYTADTECVVYALTVAAGSAVVAVSVGGLYGSAEETVRAAVFQVVSVCTTTGFATADFEKWPYLAQGVLVFFLFAGGCGGSTAGGIKFMRLIILAKVARRDLFRMIHPHAVLPLKISRRTLSPEIVSGVLSFFLLFMLVLGLATLMLTGLDIDPLTAFTATLTCLSNVGPGLGSVGPAENFAHLPAVAKVLLSLCMIMGRLELYAILIFFLPAYWKR